MRIDRAPAASAGALREHKRGRDAGLAEREVATHNLLFVPALPTPHGIQKPLEHTGFAAQPQLLGRPSAGAVHVDGKFAELRAEVMKRLIFGNIDFGNRHSCLPTTTI